ncbi:unnamed protein product [Adineta steineri]|uniref:Uncharacterized protein n=1 Tax=Adineta steineri TaxID=433720 RepID=A0A813WF06_9BILA|nr:unnamed protein product [Adineta steineri]CAF3542749.1 unnamed protein product [Adineta steineri]
MVSRFVDLERRTLLVQFIAVEPLTFYSTSDGTDLVQDILHSQLTRSEEDIFGQEGSLTIDELGEFLTFEPTDTKNRTLHLPIEHLAYCGALRRMRRDLSDQRDPDQIYRREFENVDLANRFAQYIVGPPIFVSVFHGFDNALCYTFVTQSADDACLLVMKLMRAFKLHEQQMEQQGQINQGSPSFPLLHGRAGSLSPNEIKQGSPVVQTSQAFVSDNRHFLPSPGANHIQNTITNSYIQDPRQDELIQQLLANPNLQLVSPLTPFTSQRINDIPVITASSSMNHRLSPGMMNKSLSYNNDISQLGRSSSPQFGRPPSPPILGIPGTSSAHNLALGSNNPQVIYKPNNQEVVYKQNIMVRWLQPPTPPPPAPIIIREIQAPQEVQPPIVCRQMPPCPPTPPPIIVREKPPPCPPCGQPLIIEKRIPSASLPRQVIVERYPAPPAKPPTIIYEKYLPPAPQQPRQVIVRREICRPGAYPIQQQQQQRQLQQQIPGRQLVREIIRQIPQQASGPQSALLCMPQQQQQQQQQQITNQQQAVQQLVPVFAARQHVVQPKGVRVIRQVIGPAQVGMQQQQQQQQQQIYSPSGPAFIQTVPAGYIQ